MDTVSLIEIPPKLQGWIRGCKAASEASGMGQKKLKKLARENEIWGYQHPDFQRGTKRSKGDGEWFFHGPSIHEYHLRKSGFIDQQLAALDLAKRVGL
jgi:hypothetical protein